MSIVAATRRADFSEIPIIDVGNIDRTVEEIRDAAENVGFFYAKNHGVPLAQQDGMFEQCRRFFALPQAERDALLLTNSPNYRGYLPIGARGNDQKRQKDLLESFNIGSERGPDDPFVRAGKPLHGENQWPKGLPGFREALLAYYGAMEGLTHRLLQGLSMAMGCERDALDSMFRNPLCQLRLLHYPAQQQEEIVDMIGARPHKDFGVLTILLQDEVGGLEVLNNSDAWVVAPPIRDTFVINFGLMMLNLTNDRYLAAQHRVINRYGRQRFSIPFFINPDYDATLATLPGFSSATPRYEPVHAGEKLRAFYHNLWPSAGKGSLQ